MVVKIFEEPPSSAWREIVDYSENYRPMWENPEPRWKGSSTKGRRTKKQIEKDRKKKKMNKRNRH